MASLDLALSPSGIFQSMKTEVIAELVRKKADTFWIIPANKYAETLKKAVSKSGLPAPYVRYLSALVDFESGKLKEKELQSVFETSKKDVVVADIVKYFGELLGPLHLMKGTAKYKNVIFPIRSNYELFDFFMELSAKPANGSKYVGYSSKVEGGTSNTLTPSLIGERLKSKKNLTGDDKIVAEVLTNLSEMGIFAGLATAVGILAEHNKLPDTIPKAAIKKIDFEKDAAVLEANKSTQIDKMKLSSPVAYRALMDDYVLPRLKSVNPESYRSGKEKYIGTNVAYGLGMIIADANKTGKLDMTKLVSSLFTDLNVIKLSVGSNGIPRWELKNVSTSKGGKYSFRSKHRWTVVKDKLGVQL